MANNHLQMLTVLLLVRHCSGQCDLFSTVDYSYNDASVATGAVVEDPYNPAEPSQYSIFIDPTNGLAQPPPTDILLSCYTKCCKTCFSTDKIENAQRITSTQCVQPTENSLRLTGGPTNTSGRLEIRIADEWQPMCGPNLRFEDFKTACRQLKLGYPVARACQSAALTIAKNENPIISFLMCSANSAFLEECIAYFYDKGDCSEGSKPLGVACSGDGAPPNIVISGTRLVFGGTRFAGVVQVLVAGVWMDVCRDEWRQEDANVACRQLGFGDAATSLRMPVLFYEVRHYMMATVSCSGEESNLAECRITTGVGGDCCGRESASMICGQANITTEQQTVNDSCPPSTTYAAPIDLNPIVATDVVFILGNLDGVGPRVKTWLAEFGPYLDANLRASRIRVQLGCRNHFSIIGVNDLTDYQVYLSSSNASLYPVEDFNEVIRDLPESVSTGNRPVLSDYEAIEFALDNVTWRPLKSTCRIGRHVVFISSQNLTYEDHVGNLTMEELLDRFSELEAFLHAIVPGEILVGNTYQGIGRTTNSGYGALKENEGGGYTIDRAVTNLNPNSGPFRALTVLALNTSGSAWDISFPNQDLRSVCLTSLVITRLQQLALWCLSCQCSALGEEQCSVRRDTFACQCQGNGGKVVNESCVFQQEPSPTTAAPNITTTPAESEVAPTIRSVSSSISVMVVAVLASVSAFLVLLILLIVVIVVHRRHKKHTAKRLQEEKSEDLPSLKIAAQHVMAILAAPGASMLKIIPDDMLSFTRTIGKGQFGEVYQGLWHPKAQGEGSLQLPVAIKMLHDMSASEQGVNELLDEYFLQKSLGEHPNLVNVLVGGLFKGQPCIVMEYMEGGNLLAFLRNVKGAGRLANSGDIHLPTVEKLDISYQTALGLEFLSSKKVIHRDLAARNILIQEHSQLHGKLIVKISDWGLSRKVLYEGIYQAQTNRMLPMKWMAIESLTDGTFSMKTDVWSFGVLLWEIETMGDIPYLETANALLQQMLQNGMRLQRPGNCTNFMHSMMTACWNQDPDKRPTFESIVSDFSRELEKEMNYIDILGDDEPGAAADIEGGNDSRRRSSNVVTQVLQQLRQASLDTDNIPDGEVVLNASSRSLPFPSRDGAPDNHGSPDTTSRYAVGPVRHHTDLENQPVQPTHSFPVPSVNE